MIPAAPVLQAVLGSFDFVRLAPHFAQEDREELDDNHQMTEMKLGDSDKFDDRYKLDDRDNVHRVVVWLARWRRWSRQLSGRASRLTARGSRRWWREVVE